MGRRKQFTKGNSSRYALVFQSSEQDGEVSTGRVIVPKELPPIPEQQPLRQRFNFFEHEYSDLGSKKRQEIVQLGLPDDGYDYTKHLRAVAKDPNTQNDAHGIDFVPSQLYVRPKPDTKVIDARRLTVISAAESEEQADGRAGGVAAMARVTNRVNKQAREEIQEIATVLQAEEVTYTFKRAAASTSTAADDLNETPDVPGLPQLLEGEGDLLDDFVLDAARYDDDEEDEYESGGCSSSDDEEWCGSQAAPSLTMTEHARMEFQRRLETLSVVSDRMHPKLTDHMSQVQDRFEALAIQYEDDDIGSLSGSDIDIPTGGCADISEYDHVIQHTLKQIQQQSYVVDHDIFAEQERDSQADVAGSHPGAQDRDWASASSSSESDQDEAPARKRGGWDVQSVLTLRSNTENHPRVLSECGPAINGRINRIHQRRKVGLPRVDGGGGGGREIDVGSVGLSNSDEEDSVGDVGSSVADVANIKDKKERKKAVKEMQRAARVRKKQLKEMFKQEDGKLKAVGVGGGQGIKVYQL